MQSVNKQLSLNRNIFFTFFTQGPTMIMGLFINYFITKAIKAEGRGAYAIFTADTELLSQFLGFMITSAIVYYVANRKIALEKLLGIGILTTAFSMLALLAIFGLLKLFAFNGLLFPGPHDHLFHYAFLFLALLFIMTNQVLSSIFQGKSMFRIINTVAIINSSVNLLVYGACFFIALQNPAAIDINTILAITLVVYLLNVVVWLYLYRKHIRVRPVFRFDFKTDIRPLFIFISIGHLSQILSFLTYRMDYWILEHYKGSQELGYYAQAVGFGQMFWRITNPILTVLIPFLAAEDNPTNMSHFKFYSRLNFTVILIGVTVFFVFAGYIFPIYGADFSRSVVPFRIMAFGIVMSCITKVFATYIYVKNKLHYNLIVTIVSFVFTITLDLLLIPKHGMIGASIATTISYTMATIMIVWFVTVRFKLNIRDTFFLKGNDVRAVIHKFSGKYLS